MIKLLQAKKVITLIIILHFSISSFAQKSSYYRIDTIPVYQYGKRIAFPWVGGFNSPQFSSVKLDSLGISLIVVFDRCGNHFYTFLNEGIKDSASYVYAPQYEKNFPVCNNWALLRDYNCDGIPDIFSSTGFGVNLYKGFYNSSGEWDFKEVSSQLEYPFSTYMTNVFVPGGDIPAIDDIDGDGDLDILAFGTTGGYINYYKNTSEETGHGCDSFNYIWASGCWGNAFENYYLTMMLNVCSGFIGSPPPGESDEVAHHAGNTLCSFDEDSSGNKSIIWGGITFPYSDFLHNKGLNDTAHIDWQDTTFPGYHIPDSTRSFPAAYSFDVDNDGYSDLIFAPNYTFGTQDFNMVRYYKQIPGKPTGTLAKQYYDYQNDSLFCKDMIDVGSGSSPAFFHYFNNDTSSVYDLIIGSIGKYNLNAIPNGCLTLYQNIGKAGHPAFQLINNNFASITNYRLQSVVPTFGNLRNKGTEDMILGNSQGTLYYFENIAPVGSPAQYQLMASDSGGEFYDSINVGGYSAPQLVDVDGDGLLDLIIGCQDGVLYYYHNDGTKTVPKFDLASTNWGGVFVTDTADKSFIPGFSHPFLYHDSTGKSVLLVGSSPNGTIYRYDGIDNNLNGPFTLTDNAFENITTGFESQCTVTGANILGNSNLEFAVGNYRGGITIYTNSPGNSTAGIQQVQKEWVNCTLYPNPADNNININLPGVSERDIVKVSVQDELGRTVISNSFENSQTKISMTISQLPAGLYFCRITIEGEFVVRKFIVTHRD